MRAGHAAASLERRELLHFVHRLSVHPRELPPVFLALALPSWRWLGPNLLAPRVLSLVATLGLLLAASLLLRRAGAGRTAALAAALLIPVPWFVVTWAPLGRVDMLACLLSVLGLLVQERADERRGARRFLAFPLFWLAFFTKQSALLAPAALFIHGLLVRERRRRAVVDLAVFSAGLIVLLGALLVATGGLAWRHLVPFTAAASYEWDRMRGLGRGFLLLASPLLLVIGCAVASAPRRILANGHGRYVTYLVLGLISIVTAAKAGAAQNYLIEPWVAAVLCGLLLAEDLATARHRLSLLVPAVAVVALLVAGLLDRSKTGKPLVPQDAREFAELRAMIVAAPGPVLSENLSLVVQAGKPVLVEPFGLGHITRRGLASAERVAADCRAQRFSLIIWESRMADIPGLAACMATRYEHAKLLGPYEVLVPVR